MTGLPDDACKRVADAIANCDSQSEEVLEHVLSPELTDLLGEDGIENIILERVVGRGASGFVVAGTQLQPVRRGVAVKILRHGIDGSRVLSRFEAERQALAVLEGCSVPIVYSAGLTKLGRPYVCTQFIEGLPITTWCDAHQLNIEQRISLVIDACKTLQQTHDAGIVHRDIKPSNMLVQDTLAGLRVVLIDFGVAKAVGEPLSNKPLTTLDGEFLGTPEYMSPEQTRSAANVDFRTDVWAIGVLLHKLCSGREPFVRTTKDATSLGKLIDSICHADPPSIRGSFRRESVGAIAKRCLEKSPEDRFSSASELATELERGLSLKEPKKKTGRLAATGLLFVAAVLFIVIQSGIFDSKKNPVSTEFESLIFDGSTSFISVYTLGNSLSGVRFSFRVKMPKVTMENMTQRLFQKRIGAWTGVDVWVWSDVDHPEQLGQVNLLVKDNDGVPAEVAGLTRIDDNQWHEVDIYLPPMHSSLPRGMIFVDGKMDGSFEGLNLGEISSDEELVLGEGLNQGKGHFLVGEIENFLASRPPASWWDTLTTTLKNNQ